MKDKLIGIQLKKARLEKGLSQEELGQKIGVTWEMISRYENGRSNPLKHIRKLAEILSKPASYFVAGVEGTQDEFNLSTLVARLKDEGIGYSKSLKNVIKLLPKLTGKGIEEDILQSSTFYEVGSTLTDKYGNCFALKLDQVSIQAEVNLDEKEIGIFARNVEAKISDIVIGYDGIKYKIMRYNPNALDTALAVLIATERRYRD